MYDSCKGVGINYKGCSMEGQKSSVMLMNIHNPPAEGNFSDGQGNTIKPLTVEDYSCHMSYEK
jgi:hypothetical protein